MPTRIQVKRGSSDPSGLTTGEFGFNTTNSTLFIGSTASGSQRWIGGEVTGGTDMGAGSAASQTRVPTQNAVYQYARNNFVHRLNGITGGITLNAGANITITSSVAGGITIASSASGSGVTAGDLVTWTQLQTFNSGISAGGGITFNGPITGVTATFTRLVTTTAGLSADGGITFNGTITGATATFNRLVTMTAGLSASGATFGGVNGVQILYDSLNDNLGIGNNIAGVLNGAGLNTAFGSGVLSINSGTQNTGFGAAALQNNSSGDGNFGLGYLALNLNSTGSQNCAVGNLSLASNTNGSDNTGLGSTSLRFLTGGSRNTAVGRLAARRRGTGTDNLTGATGGIYIGYDVRASANSQINEIVIGTEAVGLGSNTAVIGATTQTAATIYGQLNLPGGLSAAGGITLNGVVFANNGITASAIDVTGLAKFNGNVTVGDNAADVLTVTSGATFGITDHSGVARFAAGVTANTINVIGEARFAGFVNISRGVTIGFGGGVLNAVGGITGATFTATVDVTGAARFNGGATASALNVTGVAQLNDGATASALDVTGAARFNGGATASALDVTGAARFNGGATASALNVTGVARLNGGVTASTLNVTGISRFADAAQFLTTIGSSTTGQLQVAIPAGLFAGTTQAGLQFASDDGIGGLFATTFQTTTLSANRTITLPDDSGTCALTKGTVWRLNGITGGITLNAGTNITITSSVAGGITIASSASGGGGVTTADPYTWSALQSFSAGISAAGVTTSFLRPNSTNGITVYGANFSLEDVGYHVVKTTVMGLTTVNVNQPTVGSYNHNIANNSAFTIGNTAGTVRIRIDQTGESSLLYLTSTTVQVQGELELAGATLDAPRLKSYCEVTSAPAISAGTLTLDLLNGNFFNVALNANITTLTIANSSASANTSTGFTLVFTADGTPRSVTWGGSILWASGNAPTLTSTNGKRDVFSFITTNGGTNWLGFVGGQNY